MRDRQACRQTDKQTVWEIDRLKDICLDIQTDGRTGRQMGLQTDKRADRLKGGQKRDKN